MGRVPGAMGRGTFLHWRNKKFSVFQTRKVSTIFKNQLKIYNFLKILQEILCFFQNFLKIISKFSRKLREKVRKFWKCAFVRGSGGGAPRS